MDFKTENYPMLQPHLVAVTILVAYYNKRSADAAEREMRKLVEKNGLSCELFLISDRPPLKKNQRTLRLIGKLQDIAAQWEIPLNVESSVWPSVAGLVPKSTAVVCGVGPVARDLYTSQEAIQRFSLMQRTMLLAQFLLQDIPTQTNHERKKSKQ
jgi:D-alanine-D-alanine ligase